MKGLEYTDDVSGLTFIGGRSEPGNSGALRTSTPEKDGPCLSGSNRQLHSHSRIDSLDFLRGVAALAVAWFHFTGPHNGTEPAYSLSQYGYLGVPVFFVISGLVIPLSLHRTNYRLRNFRTFVLKRLIRLEPPYLITILIIILVGYLSTHLSLFRGEPFTVTWRQLLLHFGYLNAFVDPNSWLNIVFWTLAIEFQFYLLIGLIYPLISSKKASYRWVSLLSLCSLGFLFRTDSYVFHYLFIFFMGISIYQNKVGLISRRTYVLTLLFLTIGALSYVGTYKALAAAITVMAIYTLNFKAAPFKFLGNISYSLYLLHVPIGIKVIHLGSRLIGNTAIGTLTLNLTALGVTILASYIFYILVESPSQKLSSRIRYTTPTYSLYPEKLTPKVST